MMDGTPQSSQGGRHSSSLAHEPTITGDHQIQVGSRSVPVPKTARVRTPKDSKPIAYVHDTDNGNNLHVITEHGEVSVGDSTKKALNDKIDAEPDRFHEIRPVPIEGSGKGGSEDAAAGSTGHSVSDFKANDAVRFGGKPHKVIQREDAKNLRLRPNTGGGDKVVAPADQVEHDTMRANSDQEERAARQKQAVARKGGGAEQEAAESNQRLAGKQDPNSTVPAGNDPVGDDDLTTPDGKDTPTAPNAGSVADSILSKVSSIEPSVTKTMQSIAKQYGGEMQGLEFREKARDSMMRKISADAVEKNITIEQAGEQLGDALRYTMVSDPEQHADMAKNVLKEFEDQGYNLKVKNFWLDRQNTYRGINAQLQSPEGVIVELQFNTPDSLKVKMEQNHPLYEQARVLPNDDPKRRALEQQMVKNSQGIPRPTGILQVQPRDNIVFNKVGTADQTAAAKEAAVGRAPKATPPPK
jgi:hypothetical protein